MPNYFVHTGKLREAMDFPSNSEVMNSVIQQVIHVVAPVGTTSIESHLEDENFKIIVFSKEAVTGFILM